MALQNSSCHKYLNDVPVRLMIRNNCNLFFFLRCLIHMNKKVSTRFYFLAKSLNQKVTYSIPLNVV